MKFFGSTPQLLTDGAIYTKVRELIVDAKEELTIISPYIDPSSDFVRQIEEATDSRGVNARVVFRKDKAADYRGTDWFRRLADVGVSLTVIDRLHSKIYRNESATIVTSMNFYSSSGENSFETGVFFENDHKLSAQTDAYVKSLERHMESIPGFAKTKQKARDTNKSSPARSRAPAGHCIRCAGSIPLNSERPYCADDFETWRQYNNENFEDKYCHRCGRQHPATMRKPLCRDCYDQVS